MHRLHAKYGESADFIALDVDDLAVRSTRMGLGMRNRSHFVLIDQDGNRLAQWFGPLDEAAMFDQIAERLAETGS